MYEIPKEVRMDVAQFKDSLDVMLSRRGKRRMEVQKEIIHNFAHTLNGERLKRDRMKDDCLNRMWNSELGKRMDLLDEQIQISHDKIVLLKNDYRIEHTPEEYTDMLRRLKDVVATQDPYDMGPHIKECLDEMDLAEFPAVPELIAKNLGVNQENASTRQSRDYKR